MIRDGRPPGTADPVGGSTGTTTGAPTTGATTTGATDAETSDSGVATVWAAAAVAVLTTVLVACLHLGAALLARHRAESAADLAALAAAREAVRGEAPACRRAVEIAAAMGGEVARCRLVGWNALVEVRVVLPFALPGLTTANGRAMAGPDRPPGKPGSASGRWVPPGGPPRRAPWAQPTCAARRAIRRSDGALVVAAAPIGDGVWPAAPEAGLLEQVPAGLGRFRNRGVSLPRLRWGRSVV